MTVLDIPIFPIRDVHGAEMTMKRIPLFKFNHYLTPNKILCLPVRNMFDGSIMPMGARQRTIIEPDEFSQAVICLHGVVKETGHNHGGRIPAKESCMLAKDDDTKDMSAELGLGNGSTVCKNLTMSDHPQLSGGFKGIIFIMMGGIVIVVDKRIESFAHLHFHEVFSPWKVNFGSGCCNPATVVHNVQ